MIGLSEPECKMEIEIDDARPSLDVSIVNLRRESLVRNPAWKA